MARTIAARRGGAIALVLTLAAGPAAAQEPLPTPPSTPPATLACALPAADIAAPAALPHLAAALGARRAIRVLAIGSSSTAGVGASSRRQTYPAQLETMLETALKNVDVDVINRGVSGEVAATTAERLKMQVATLSPDLVLWQVGTNDALSRVPVEDFANTVRDVVRWLKEHRVDVVLVGLQFTPRLARDEHYLATREALRAVAAEENVLLVRRFEAMQFIAKGGNQLLAGDEFHLNDLGYRCMAEHVARALVLNAFVRGTPPTP